MKRFVFLSLLFTFLTVNAYSQAKQFLCIDVTPSDATLEINGVIKETNNGEYEELLPLGTYSYKISRDGYSTATGVVDISDPNKKYSFKINLKKPYGYLHVQKPDMPDLQFFIDDTEIDAAEVDHITLPSGIHHLTIIHPLCKIYQTIVTISDETNTTVKPVLEQINIYTTLTTSENAEIYVNGEYKGIGTWRGVLQPNKIYQFESKEARKKKQSIVKILKPEDHESIINIPAPTPIYGSIDVHSSHEAKVYIDGKYVGNTPYTSSEILIEDHTIHTISANYESPKQNINIKSGKKSTVFFDIPQGSLTIQSVPSKAEIYLDDKFIGHTPMHISQLVVNQHKVEVKFDDYFSDNKRISETKEVIIKKDKESSLVFNKNDILGLLSVNTSPANAVVSIDGKVIGKTPGKFYIKPGEHMLKVSCDEHKSYQETIYISAGDKLSYSLSSITINCDVPNSNIYLNELCLDGPGKYILPTGNYNVIITSEGCDDYYKNISISEEGDNSISVTSLFIRSTPADALIILNGQEMGRPPKRFILEKGSFVNVELNCDGYKDYKTAQHINSAQGIIAILHPNFTDKIDVVDDDIEVEDIIIDSAHSDDFEITIMDYVEEVEEEVVEEDAIPFQLVEEKPSFQGGDANQFSKWVNQRLVYPESAKENGVQGRVTLQFTIERDGTLTNVKVLRGVDPSLDKEAVRVVSSSPKWTPGKQRERAVPVTYTFPVIFQLR